MPKKATLPPIRLPPIEKVVLAGPDTDLTAVKPLQQSCANYNAFPGEGLAFKGENNTNHAWDGSHDLFNILR